MTGKGRGGIPKRRVATQPGNPDPACDTMPLPRLNFLLPASNHVVTPGAVIRFRPEPMLEHHSAPVALRAVEFGLTHSLRLPEARGNGICFGHYSGVDPYQTRSMHTPVSRDTLSRIVSPCVCS